MFRVRKGQSFITKQPIEINNLGYTKLNEKIFSKLLFQDFQQYFNIFFTDFEQVIAQWVLKY